MKYVLRSIAAAAALAALVWLTGFLLPARHQAAAALRVQASPEAVWAVLTAVGDYPRWRSDVAASEVLAAEPLAWKQTDGKGRITLHSEAPGRLTEKWVERFSGEHPRVSGERIFLIVADTGGCTVALTEKADYRSPWARFRARFVDGYAEDLRKLMDELRKRLAE